MNLKSEMSLEQKEPNCVCIPQHCCMHNKVASMKEYSLKTKMGEPMIDEDLESVSVLDLVSGTS